MLLTLAVSSLRSLVAGDGGKDPLDLFDVPRFAMRTLELRGLNIPVSMLTGLGLNDLDRLRDAADKEACPCLLLVGDDPLPLGTTGPRQEQALERLHRLATAAHRLGCSAMAVSVDAPDQATAFERTAEAIRSSMQAIDRLEINVLLAPREGLTFNPVRLTELIKKIGGFRIGSMPSFAHAVATGDPVATLRKLAPYAGALHASVSAFAADGTHVGYSLDECVRAIRSVGYANTLAIEYIGHGDPVPDIERARHVLSEAIEAESSD